MEVTKNSIVYSIIFASFLDVMKAKYLILETKRYWLRVKPTKQDEVFFSKLNLLLA